MSQPSHCPGVDSDQAGKSDACDGCPNKGLCSSGDFKLQQENNEKDFYDIARKLSTIKNIIIIMSGKGGVGKSTVASQLARFIAQKDDKKFNVGLLDIDICGPSIPKIMGVENEEIFNSSSGWSPIFIDDNLSIISCGFLLESLDDAIIWRGPKKNGIIKQFLRDVDWGDLDYLLIDTPPGTSDEHLSITSFLKYCQNVLGTILVTTPQEIAQMDVRKQIEFCKKIKLPIIGYIENMSIFICPKCHKENVIFKKSIKNIEDKYNNEIKLLGSIPIDPIIGESCDKGKSLFNNDNDDAENPSKINPKIIEAFEEIWKNILKHKNDENQ